MKTKYRRFAVLVFVSFFPASVLASEWPTILNCTLDKLLISDSNQAKTSPVVKLADGKPTSVALTVSSPESRSPLVKAPMIGMANGAKSIVLGKSKGQFWLGVYDGDGMCIVQLVKNSNETTAYVYRLFGRTEGVLQTSKYLADYTYFGKCD